MPEVKVSNKIEKVNNRARKRKTKKSKETIIKAFRESNGIVQTVADKLDVSRPTVYNYINSDPEIEEAFKEARNTLVDTAQNKLVSIIEKGDDRVALDAVKFLLNAIGEYKSNVKSEVNISGISESLKEVLDESGIPQPPKKS
jgi:transposase